MYSSRLLRHFALIATTLLSLVITATGQALAQWYPEQPVKLIIMAGKGGGADKMARRFIQIISDEEMSPVPFEPVNMPGNSGGDALQYMKTNSGNPHVVMVTLNSFFTTPLRQPKLEIDITTFAPIARMAEDTFLLWVTKDSGISDLDQFIKQASAKGPKWLMAGTGKGGEDNLLTDLLNQAYKLKMAYKPFKGGGAVAKELIEAKANSTVNNPSEQDKYYRQGKSRPIAAFTPERLDQYPDVPTFAELGRDMTYFMQRSIVGPPGLSPDVIAFYQETFQAVYESKEWQDYMNTNSLRGKFATGDALMNYWISGKEAHRKILAETKAVN
ncbi:MAG: Bug family tripartite tricarboxylate transporter substrate binding protein [Anderseniella sp.]